MNFSSLIVEFRPSERRENLPFCFSLFLYMIFFSFLSCWLPPFSFLLDSLLFSLVQPTLSLFALHFHFLFIFSFLLFSHLFFFFLHFLFSFSPLDCINRMVPKLGNFLPTSSFATCHSHIFLNFFHSPLFSSCDTWLNVSHLSQFALTHGYHAMCLAPRVPCGIHIVLPCITRQPMPQKK